MARASGAGVAPLIAENGESVAGAALGRLRLDHTGCPG